MSLRPDCPRCGYDQSGLIATWSDHCPTAGLCSECGLSFYWSTVLNPEIRHTALIESGSGLSTRRFAAASVLAFRPRKLWRELDLAFPIRPRRLRAFALIWLLIGHIAAMAIVMIPFMWITWAAPLDHMGWLRAVVCPYLSELQFDLVGASFSGPMAPMYLMTYIPVAVMPITLLIFFKSMSKIRVRKAHLWRGLVYSVPLAVAAAWVLIIALASEMVFEDYTRGVRYAQAMSGAFMTIVVLGWPVWLALWWRRFLKDYLKLPRAGWVALAMLIITVLFTVVVSVIYSINELT